jgi:hypothetical protein
MPMLDDPNDLIPPRKGTIKNWPSKKRRSLSVINYGEETIYYRPRKSVDGLLTRFDRILRGQVV